MAVRSLLLSVVPTHVGVDRPPAGSGPGRRRRPHARGGGPAYHLSHHLPRSSSPRTWGWTGIDLRASADAYVVPTHVGVDRERPPQYAETPCRPHARGGGPGYRFGSDKPNPSSPRTWGWTEADDYGPVLRRVVPTHVGVDRRQDRPHYRWLSRPHARGGGPYTVGTSTRSDSSSPRTWGWTVLNTIVLIGRLVVPTHVGVDR